MLFFRFCFQVTNLSFEIQDYTICLFAPAFTLSSTSPFNVLAFGSAPEESVISSQILTLSFGLAFRISNVIIKLPFDIESRGYDKVKVTWPMLSVEKLLNRPSKRIKSMLFTSQLPFQNLRSYPLSI